MTRVPKATRLLPPFLARAPMSHPRAWMESRLPTKHTPKLCLPVVLALSFPSIDYLGVLFQNILISHGDYIGHIFVFLCISHTLPRYVLS